MSTSSAPPGLVLAAHGLHYALIAGGLVVVIGLLWATRPAARQQTCPDHARRVEELRGAVGAGTLGVPQPPAAASAEPPLGDGPSLPRRQLAATSSAGAAAVHAAASPNHLREGLLLGGFFVVAAGAQLAWAGLALRRTGRSVWLAGLAGNLLVVLLWVVTRTAGLPFGLLDGTEPVGAWDAVATALEITVVIGCWVEARRGRQPDFAAEGGGGSAGWPRLATAWLLVVVVALAVLTATGVPT